MDYHLLDQAPDKLPLGLPVAERPQVRLLRLAIGHGAVGEAVVQVTGEVELAALSDAQSEARRTRTRQSCRW